MRKKLMEIRLIRRENPGRQVDIAGKCDKVTVSVLFYSSYILGKKGFS